MKELVSEKCCDLLKLGSGHVQRTIAQKVDKKTDKTGSRLKDISKERRGSEEDSDLIGVMHDDLDIGELFS